MREKMDEGLREIATQIKRLTVTAKAAYCHQVNALINEKVQDPHQIEHLLDSLLDFCFDDGIVVLYRKLCLYYFDIDPEATVDYVRFYRDFWDNDGNTSR